MKKLLVLALTMVLVSCVSYGQTKTPTTLTENLKDGLENEHKITFKVYNPEKLDSLWGDKSTYILRQVVKLCNYQLMYMMNNKDSYKPIQTPKNTILYMNHKNETNISITLVVEAKNGYGNPLTKSYSCFATGDFLSNNIYETVKVHVSSF